MHVERENSSVESILSFSGVCRFTTNFRNWRKKIRDVRKCRKKKGRVKSRRNAHVDMTLEMA